MSLIIAVNCSHKTCARLSSFCDALSTYSEHGNFSRPEDMHLTLVFLGDCDLRQTAVVKHALNTVKFAPFSVTLAGGGYLDKGRPNLVFCGLLNDSGYNKLRCLQYNLLVNLSAKGIVLDQRKFWPHITLGHEVVWKNTGKFSSLIDVHFPTIEEPVTSIALIKSERIDDSITYTTILEKELSLYDYMGSSHIPSS